jgi:integrase
LKGEEMFELTTKDFKLVFEYDTEEELKIALENAMKMQVEQQIQRYKEVKHHLEKQARSEANKNITIDELKEKYIAQAKYDNNVGSGSIADYITTFNKLSKYFGKDKKVNDISVEDIEAFKLHLSTIEVRRKPLSKKTINKHLIYIKQFLKWAQGRGYIEKNVAETVKLYNKKQIRREEPKKENYTDKEIRLMITNDYGDEALNNAFKILAYTGMRVGELYSLSKEDIKIDESNGIKYIDLTLSKSEAGERVIPIHSEIENILDTMKYPISEKSKNGFSKSMRYYLKKLLDDNYKTVHRIRATAIKKMVEATKNSDNPYALYIIQEIVGHSKDDKEALTLETYAGGFSLQDKKEMIEKIDYNLNN